MELATLGFLSFCFVLFAGYWLILWLAMEEPEIVIPAVIVALSIFIFYTMGGNILQVKHYVDYGVIF